MDTETMMQRALEALARQEDKTPLQILVEILEEARQVRETVSEVTQ